jgi:hypothetical protein
LAPQPAGAIVHVHFLKALVLASVLCAAAGDADALSRKDIYGKWCSAGGSERFSRDKLIAVRASDRVRIVFKISRYDFDDKAVKVYWTDTEGNDMVTTFGEFSADRRHMVQLKNDAGPQRKFHRC